MTKYLISFDLDTSENNRSTDYNKINEVLLECGDLCKPLSNVYILSSKDVDAVQIREKLMSFLKLSDFVLVVGLNGVFASFNYSDKNARIKELLSK